MKKLLEKTDLLAGVFAVIAFVAIVCEIVLGGFTTESIAGGIKDMSGILVDVLVLLVAASVFIKKKHKNIASMLESAVEEWGNNNQPLIFKVEGYKQAQGSSYTQGFALLQNPREYINVLEENLHPGHPDWLKYASYSSRITGKFIDLPSYEEMTKEPFDISVVMTQSHFKNMESFESIFYGIRRNIKNKYAGVLEIMDAGKEHKIKMHFNQAIKTEDDIDLLIEVFDYIVSLVKVVA